MALGRRKTERQHSLWIATDQLPRSAGHVFYGKLNELLREAGFDRLVESLCEPYYHTTQGRPGIPPGVYFRMLFVGYFEGIGSQRGIAWRCGDSLSLREFLGIDVTEQTPDHSSLTRVRDRLPLEVHLEAFRFVLQVADEKGLLKGKTIAVDATTLEANAAMKTIVRRDTGDDWKAYVRKLMIEAGEIDEDDTPTVEEIVRFDRKRKDKKVSNEEWKSKTDPDSRIMKMKDGRTHLAYKAEHAVDLDSELLVAATIHHANQPDGETIGHAVSEAQDNMIAAGSDATLKDVVADKGYYKHETLGELEFTDGLRTYVVEPKRSYRCRWKEKPDEWRQAVTNNRRRCRGKRGRALQRQRSEKVERSFAHVCETGGGRRAWLRGIEKVQKRYWITAAAYNLGVIMRTLFGIGTARSLQAGIGLFDSAYVAPFTIKSILRRMPAPRVHHLPIASRTEIGRGMPVLAIWS